MSKTFRPNDPEQHLLLPAALQEWRPQDHLSCFISDVVEQLALSAVTAHYQVEERGGPSIPSQDDGQCAALRLLQRGGLLKTHRPEASRGHRLPGAGGQQHLRIPHNFRLSQGPPGGLGRFVPPGAEDGRAGLLDGREESWVLRVGQIEGHGLRSSRQFLVAAGLGPCIGTETLTSPATAAARTCWCRSL